MRTLLIASAGLALMAGSSADAQRTGLRDTYGQSRMDPAMRDSSAPTVRGGRDRWGSKIDGHWWGGTNAPGGWASYRRPYRGWALPVYWNRPRFYVSDWRGYGLDQPPRGYNWVRYYDDAVLVDQRGSVFDTADGIDWDSGAITGPAVDYAADTGVYASPADRGYGATYDTPRAEAPRYERRSTSSGIGGAVVGGVVGGVAGNAIAGRGNRLAGTLIGAGVGAGAGYAVDRAANTRDVPVAPSPPSRGYGATYGTPGQDQGGFDRGQYDRDQYDRGGYEHGGYGQGGYEHRYASPPPPRGGQWRSPDGRTVVTTSSGGYPGGYGSGYGAGYSGGNSYYPGGSSTTIVVQSQPMVTTTRTETWADTVTYSRPKARAKRVYRTKLSRRASR